MKPIEIKVNNKGAVPINEFCKMLEITNDESLNLVRSTYPYKLPSGYMSWRFLSSVIATGIIGNRDRQVHIRRDLATVLHSHKAALWFVQHAPIYCIKNELLDSILNTDILNSSEVIRDLQPTIPSFILLFPKNTIISPENSPIEFSFVHLSDKNHPNYSYGNYQGVEVPYISHEADIYMHWSTIDNAGTLWFSGAGLYPDGRIVMDDKPIGLNKINEKEKIFLGQMRSIILQIFLLLQYETNIFSEVIESELPKPKVQGFKKISPSQNEEIKFLYPRWINEPIRKIYNQKKKSSTSHASPVTHWRRGHWKTVPCGTGRTDRKWVRIAPTLVNP